MCELRPGNIVTVGVTYSTVPSSSLFNCSQVLLAVIVGSSSLSNVLPELETFASALGSATAVFAVIDRVSTVDLLAYIAILYVLCVLTL